MTHTHNAQSGLAKWRERQAEEKRERMAELERYRAEATEVERDGRTFTLVRIPDVYDFKPLQTTKGIP